jgi:hypothetical protein
MTLFQALKKNKPIRLKGRTWNVPDTWRGIPPSLILSTAFIEPEWFLSVIHLTKEDILSKDWEIKDVA